MSDYTTPRGMVKALLRGEAPQRPLLMPILFSLGARMENLSLQNFRENPTKIVNALRQIRSVLKVDGLTCYFDPFLEIEALGCRREWQTDGLCTLAVPAFSNVVDLREKLNSPDALADKGCIPVTCEVLRRVKVMLKDEPALMIRVTGPVSLARQLSRGVGNSWDHLTSIPQDVVEFATEASASVSRIVAEAGADVILLAEAFGSEMPVDSKWYSSLLAPIVNIIRFYEALPVLWLGRTSEQTLAALAGNLSECVLCPTLTSVAEAWAFLTDFKDPVIGCALPIHYLCQDSADLQPLLMSIDAAPRPNLCMLTSEEDIAYTPQLSVLAERLKIIQERLRTRPR
jgi:uroporphyrinogen-III decarboxylase